MVPDDYVVQLKVNPNFKSFVKFECDHSNESYLAVLSCGTVYYAIQGSSHFLNLWMKPYCVKIQMKVVKQYFQHFNLNVRG